MNLPTLAIDDPNTGLSHSAESKALMREYIGRALVWVDTLDRSVLGEVAVSRELLAVMYAKRLVHDDDSLPSWKRIRIISDLHTEDYFIRRLPGEKNSFTATNPSMQSMQSHAIQASAEVSLWLGLSGVPDSYAEGNDVLRSDFLATLRYLIHLVDSPEALAYYAAGIRDEAFIRSCIAGGVDAELAVATSY